MDAARQLVNWETGPAPSARNDMEGGVFSTKRISPGLWFHDVLFCPFEKWEKDRIGREKSWASAFRFDYHARGKNKDGV
jgi:hypothetical protein